MTSYRPVTPAILAELETIVGRAGVITDRERLEAYSHDETPREQYGHMPEVVLAPASAEQVAAIIRLANRERIPVTPRGAGSGLSGGAIPVHGGMVLSSEKLNRVLEIDGANMTITVEPGVITNDINGLVAERGLFFAGYPMSVETCCVGGNIAENAGGGKAVKYGVTGRYILGLELVTPTGEIVMLGGKLVKNVSGYNLIQLIVGSEGTLGFVTKAIIKLSARPKGRIALLALFSDPQSAIDVVPRILGEGGVLPTGIEFMDRLSVETSCRYLNEHLPWENCGAMLLIEVDGSQPAQVEEDAFTIGRLCQAGRAQEVYVADNATTLERVWSVRRCIAEAFKVYSPAQSLEDIVVPIAAIPEYVRRLAAIADRHELLIPSYGHAGDGNLHSTLVKNPAWSDADWLAREPVILREIYGLVKDLGGTLSGEHGIGSKRKDYMSLFAAPAELELYRAIKRAFDPNNIMNPGKIVDV
jgi:glycolate oxidase